MKITRVELYDRIWETPAIKLAQELGISDVALAKICKKLNVPKPPPGYWARLKFGQKVSKTALPTLTKNVATEATIDPEKHTFNAPFPKAAKAKTTGMIAVAETLQGCHPIISQTRRSMEEQKVDSTGLVQMPWMRFVLPIDVSRAQTSRALRIMDALLKALESRGGAFVKDKERPQMKLMFGPDVVAFRMFEIVDKRLRPTKPGQVVWDYEKWNCSPTGRLKFQILETHPVGGRKSWADCTVYKLEEKLADIVEWLLAAGEGAKQARLERDEWNRRYELERKRMAEEERKRQIEMAFREDLERQASSWMKAQNLRAFVKACEEQLRAKGSPLFTEMGETQWLAWARRHADQIDPLQSNWLQKQSERFVKPKERTRSG